MACIRLWSSTVKEHSRVCWKDQAYEREDHKKTTEKKNERENEREIVGLGNNGYQLSITWERPVKSGREWKVWSPKKNKKTYVSETACLPVGVNHALPPLCTSSFIPLMKTRNFLLSHHYGFWINATCANQDLCICLFTPTTPQTWLIQRYAPLFPQVKMRLSNLNLSHLAVNILCA